MPVDPLEGMAEGMAEVVEGTEVMVAVAEMAEMEAMEAMADAVGMEGTEPVARP
jgi:hypothetical protein